MNEDLVRAISEYAEKARRLEFTRGSIVDILKDIVDANVIPVVQKLLPPGYSIDTTGSYVSMVGATDDDAVHPEFCVFLRLLRDGKKIYHYNTPSYNKNVTEIRDSTKSELEKLAREYNLASINIDGEPALVV